jgi:hypothetical protein
MVCIGTTGLAELKEALMPGKAQFAFLRYMYSNDELSQRAKFLFVAWCGPEVKVCPNTFSDQHDFTYGFPVFK